MTVPKGKRTQSRPNAAELTDVILDSIADGVFTVDGDWRVTSFNRAAEQITGVRREDAIGSMCCDVFRASICEGDCAIRGSLETGVPVVHKAIYIVRPDGKRVPISISAASLVDADDAVIGGVETFRDLSVVERLRKELVQGTSFYDIVSRNHEMRKIFAVLPAIASSVATVLIEGPTGSGKELIARAIHSLSERSDKPFVAVNCGAIPDTLLESELFGYKAGAFTDARKNKPGRFALAEGGTIFLDEIGDVTPAMQVRLLRVLQERVYEPLGSTKPVKADVRVVTATNKQLQALVADGSFRDDLYYRLNVMRIKLPRLTERRDDIPLLVEHFIARQSALRGKDISAISDEALANLYRHEFPGNIRELENFIEHAFIMCPGGIIQAEHLPDEVQTRDANAPRAAAAKSFADVEAQFIWEALVRNDFNRVMTARELGVHKTTLWRKMKKLGISPP